MWTVDLLSASRDIMQCQLHRRQLSQLSHHPALTTSTAQTCDKVTVNTQLANFNFLPQSEVGGEPHNQRDGEAGGCGDWARRILYKTTSSLMTD